MGMAKTIRSISLPILVNGFHIRQDGDDPWQVKQDARYGNPDFPVDPFATIGMTLEHAIKCASGINRRKYDQRRLF